MRYISLCSFWLLATSVVFGAELHLSFANTPAGTLPTNYTTAVFGSGRPAKWQVVLDDRPSAFTPLTSQAANVTKQAVLAQTSEDMTDEHFPLCVYEGDIFRDFTFTTRFKIVSGVTEQMAGIVFRYQNPTNFYVVRASALGQNVRFYKVVDGIRTDPIGPTVQFTVGIWHTLSVKCEGTQIIFLMDDRQLTPPLNDNSFKEGKLGFWTKSDAVSYFSEATVVYRPRIPVAQQIVDGLLAEQSRILGLRIYTLATNGAARIIASKDKAEIGQPGTDAEVKAIQEGAISFGRESGAVLLTLPLHDRNGEYIAAVRLKLKSFFGETEKNALTRALPLVKRMEQYGASADDLKP
jgi:hypothetical protein